MRAAAAFLAMTACAPIVHSDSAPQSLNACPAYPCDAYAEPGAARATCVAGACLSAAKAAGDLVVTVVLPQDALSGAGRTVTELLSNLTPVAPSSPVSACTDTPCVALQPSIPTVGIYYVNPSVVSNVGSTLPLPDGLVSLPVQVTYQPLWPPDATALSSTAAAAGLPDYPVVVETSAQTPNLFGITSPTGGAAPLGYQTYLLSGPHYGRVVAPAAPFDADFPPDVNLVTQVVTPDEAILMKLDNTGTPTGRSVPRFSLSRIAGMDGFGTYLRDTATKVPLSPIKALSGTSTPDGGLLLPTNHHPPVDSTGNADALDNTELVMAAPPDAGLPDEIFTPPLLQESYAVLPNPLATLAGRVGWADGVPVPADVTFEAAAIYAVQPQSSGSDDAGSGTQAAPVGYQPQPNFAFIARARAEPVPFTPTSSYALPALPRGIYRVVVRPAEVVEGGASEIVHAVTISDCFDTTDGTAGGDAGARDGGPAVTVHLAPIVRGSAVIADGRSLAGAAVIATPIACPAAVTAPCSIPPDSARCLPRSAQTATLSDGTFSMALDPGTYAVSVQPPDGSRLPWLSKVVTITASAETPLAPLAFVVPAPTLLHLQLADALGPLVAGAVVRLFSVPAEGPAIEVGRAITDADGRFDMYLDPALQ